MCFYTHIDGEPVHINGNPDEETMEAITKMVRLAKNKLKQHNMMNFGQAIEALKEGEMLQRQGWNGKGMFIVKQIPARIGLDIIPKMQSLPQSAKDRLIERGQTIYYTNQMLIVNSEGRADSWVPSASDVFADDWEEVI